MIHILTKFQETHSTRQTAVDEERASLSAQLATVRKKLSNLLNVLSEKPSSQALLKKLTSIEEDETVLLSKLAQLGNQVSAPIIIPTIEQARANTHFIQQNLRTKDPAAIRQTLTGIIDTVKADRIGKHIAVRVDYYHVPSTVKKKPEVNYVYNSDPRGGTIYRHSLFFEGTVASSGRPKKNPIK